MVSENPLQILVGRQLGSVVFVQDYVQLVFDGPILTAITNPVVYTNNIYYKWGTPGYRDMLCERIAKIVRSASITEGQDVDIEFDDGSIILISLRDEDYQTAEAVIFTNDSHLWVW